MSSGKTERKAEPVTQKITLPKPEELQTPPMRQGLSIEEMNRRALAATMISGILANPNEMNMSGEQMVDHALYLTDMLIERSTKK